MGYWSKKIRGEIKNFGRWGRVVEGKLTPLPYEAGWQEALAKYKEQAVDLHAGRTPTPDKDTLTVRDLCNQFLTAMLRRLETGREMSPRMFSEYKATTARLVSTFGKGRLVADLGPDDFSRLAHDLAKQYGPTRRGREVQRVKTVFIWGVNNELVKTAMRYGTEFKKPSKSELRRHRAKGGKRLFTAAEIRAMLEVARPQLKAMIFLGINAALGNQDCGEIMSRHLDLVSGWLDYPRGKTGIERRAKLWPETVTALEAVRNDAADLFFITKYGKPWVRPPVVDAEGNQVSAPVDSISVQFGKLRRELEINGRNGLGFYSLRHTFRTIADATHDQPAVRLVMGHADDSIDDVYREHIDDERLLAVADHVHRWLFGDQREIVG